MWQNDENEVELTSFASIKHSPSDPSFKKKGIPLQINSIEYVKFLANNPSMVSFLKTVDAAKDRRELRQIVKDICADTSLFCSTVGKELAKKRSCRLEMSSSVCVSLVGSPPGINHFSTGKQ